LEEADTATLEAMGPREILQTNAEMQSLLEEGTDPPAPTLQEKDFAQQSADLRFYVAMAVLLVALIISIFAQRHVLKSHTVRFWHRIPPGKSVGEQDVERYEELPQQAPQLFLGVWLIFGFVYGLFAINWAHHVFPWLTPPGNPLDPSVAAGLEAGVLWQVLIGGLFLSLIYCTIAISAFAIRLTAQNYPPVPSVTRLAREIRKAVKTLGEGGKKAPSMLDIVETAWKDVEPKTGIIPIEWGMTPKQIVDIVNTFVRPLIVVLILALVCLSLYFDTLEAANTWSDEQVNAHDFWVLILAALCSGLVAMVYLPALSRLSLYAEAADDLPKKKADPGWRIEKGKYKEAGSRVLVKRDAPSGKDYDDDLERYLGASRSKMQIMLHTRLFAGGFHILLQQDLIKQLQTVLGLLAPTAAGAILQLI